MTAPDPTLDSASAPGSPRQNFDFAALVHQHRRAAVILGFILVLAGLPAFAALRGDAAVALLGFASLIASFLLGRQIASNTIFRTITDSMQSIEEARARVFRPGRAGDRSAALDLVSESSTTEELLAMLRSKVGELLARYELLTTNIAAAIVIYDTDRRVLFCSPFTEVLTGFTIDEIYGSDKDLLAEIVLESDREKFDRARSLAAMGEDYSVRYQVLHKSGLKLWLETRLVPLCDPDGKVVSLMLVTIDVTESVNHQRRIEEQNQDLSDFSYMVSHDLKAPIFTIKGMATALQEDFGEALGSEGKELLDFIMDGATRLEKLIASVIEYSSISTKQHKDDSVDLNDVMRQVLQDLSEQTKQAHASISVDSSLPVVRGDPLRCYQVFSNLVGNALKYRSKDRPAAITVRGGTTGRDLALIEVIDNGSGVPNDKLSDIFRPYHRAHGKEIEGSGIGLACVKKIVERAGGQVGVRSVQGQGSTFWVSLPTPPPKPQAIPDDLLRAYSEERP